MTDPTSARLVALALELARDHGEPFLVVLRTPPGLWGGGGDAPYVVVESDADEWARANHACRATPEGGAEWRVTT